MHAAIVLIFETVAYSEGVGCLMDLGLHVLPPRKNPRPRARKGVGGFGDSRLRSFEASKG